MHTLSTFPKWSQELDLHHLNSATYPSLTPADPKPCHRRHRFAHGKPEMKWQPNPGQRQWVTINQAQ
jgi:hypothetical protein